MTLVSQFLWLVGQFLWCVVPTGWLGFYVPESHQVQNSDCISTVVLHKLSLQVMCRTVCVVLLWSCLTISKLSFHLMMNTHKAGAAKAGAAGY